MEDVPGRLPCQAKDISQNKDSYCWSCDQSLDQQASTWCHLCPRSYHLKCLLVNEPPAVPWVCEECDVIIASECTSTRNDRMKSISMDQLSAILLKVLGQMSAVANTDAFHKPVDASELPDYQRMIRVNPMDLATVERRVRLNSYGGVEAFLADCKWILHNCIVFNGAGSPLTAACRSMLKVCRQEIQEISNCPGCYWNAMNDSDDWFTKACNIKHPLVWAKMKGYPVWPAKMLREANGSLDCRFFGAHDRAWVPVNQVQMLSEECPQPVKTYKREFELAISELKQHIVNVVERFGEFDFAPPNTPYKESSGVKRRLIGETGSAGGLKRPKTGSSNSFPPAPPPGGPPVIGHSNETANDKGLMPAPIPEEPSPTKNVEKIIGKLDEALSRNLSTENNTDPLNSTASTGETIAPSVLPSTSPLLAESSTMPRFNGSATASSSSIQVLNKLNVLSACLDRSAVSVGRTDCVQLSSDASSAETEPKTEVKNEGSSVQQVAERSLQEDFNNGEDNVEKSRPEHAETVEANAVDANSDNSQNFTLSLIQKLQNKILDLKCPMQYSSESSSGSSSSSEDADDVEDAEQPVKETCEKPVKENGTIDSGTVVPCKSPSSPLPPPPLPSSEVPTEPATEAKLTAQPSSIEEIPLTMSSVASRSSSPAITTSAHSREPSPSVSPSRLKQLPQPATVRCTPSRCSDTAAPSTHSSQPSIKMEPTQNVSAQPAGCIDDLVKSLRDRLNAVVDEFSAGISDQLLSTSFSSNEHSLDVLMRRNKSIQAEVEVKELTRKHRVELEQVRRSCTKRLQSANGRLDALRRRRNSELSRADAIIHQQAAELQRHFSSVLYEMRKGCDIEKQRLHDDHERQMLHLRQQLENEQRQHSQVLRDLEERHRAELDGVQRQVSTAVEDAVKETKKKKWCSCCGEEAIFYCCWNASYCDYPCQQRHWPQHMSSCLNASSTEKS